jgi:exodeoxyribonuclease VII small subunit
MAKRTQTAPKNFEEALSELEQILSAVEGGQISLEESLLKYERGNYLIAYCRTILSSAEKQIEQLTQDAAGNLVSTPISEKQ